MGLTKVSTAPATHVLVIDSCSTVHYVEYVLCYTVHVNGAPGSWEPTVYAFLLLLHVPTL